MKIINALLFTLLTNFAFAESFTTEADTKSFSDKSMNLFSQEKFSEGLNAAKKFWPIPEVEVDSLLNQITQQWPLIEQRFGNTVGVEFIETQRIGSSLTRHIYLHKFQNHAIYWQFDFYKPKDTWFVNSITFLDSLHLLYE